MACPKDLGTPALCVALLLVAACGDDPAPASDTDATGTTAVGDGSTGPIQSDSSGTVCAESMFDTVPGTLPADVVINIGSSLLTPHPVLLAALSDVGPVYEANDVRVALIASNAYEQPYATEFCNQCGLGPECDDPIAVNADLGAISPLAKFNDDKASYVCLFRAPGESVRHYVTFTDTEPSPIEAMGFEGLLAEQMLQADVAFHVGFMLGCSQMEGGMGLVPLAESSGGTSGNICDGVAGVRAFLEGIATPRVACGWPTEDPGADNSSDNLELVLLDTPSGGEIEMTRVADGLCSEAGAGDPPFEWFVSTIDGVENVRLCPATCGALQSNWAPGEVGFRQLFTCPG